MITYFIALQAAASTPVQDQTAISTTIPTSLWDMISYARGFEWPLGILFLVGLFILTSAYVRQWRQWGGSKKMLQINPDGVTADSFSEAIHQTKAKPGNPYFMSGSKIVEEFRRGGSAPTMVDYAFRYIDLDRERYQQTDRYISAVVYLALSLGLLGTLLGIFVLFMSGDRHEASDLVGLGIAVVSTMLALVVRLILWPLNIFLQATLRRRYNTLRKWTIAFAYALSSKESSSAPRA